MTKLYDKDNFFFCEIKITKKPDINEIGYNYCIWKKKLFTQAYHSPRIWRKKYLDDFLKVTFDTPNKFEANWGYSILENKDGSASLKRVIEFLAKH